MNAYSDPFKDARKESGVLKCPFHNEEVVMILRHEDVRQACKNWQTFSSDAPFRVPVPAEHEVRSVRQLPIETDPPQHSEYRALVEPFFQRAKDPSVIASIENLIRRFLNECLQKPAVEVVSELALPIQSKALTYLLNVPESEADLWIRWGIHVFKVGEGSTKGAELETYLNHCFDRALAQPGPDFFTALTQARFEGRPLTREEMLGFANLTFAGGRDTVIHTLACAVGHLAKHPEALEFLRSDPKRITLASEEIFRVFMPLTHIGRVCPAETTVHGVTVPADHRVSMGWASANFDETVFPDPEEVRLDRKPNPHLSFGFGTHLCLGAPHARLLLRTLLRMLCEQVRSIRVLEAALHVEREAGYERTLGYESLRVAFESL
jgi:cytochrome P450